MEVEGRSPSPHHGSVPDEFISIRRSTELDVRDSGVQQHTEKTLTRQENYNEDDGEGRLQ